MMFVRFLVVIVTSLALVAPASHLFVLPNKIGMPADQYFATQGIYQGWWIVGLLLPASALANAALAITTNESGARALAIATVVLIVANLVIFAIWTQPANAATQNWTIRPENWEALRVQWEYSHAINAGVTFSRLLFGDDRCPPRRLNDRRPPSWPVQPTTPRSNSTCAAPLCTNRGNGEPRPAWAIARGPEHERRQQRGNPMNSSATTQAHSTTSNTSGQDGLAELRREFASLKDHVARFASQASGEVAKSIGGAASSATDASSDLVSNATEQAKTFAAELEGMARRNPLGTIAGAVLVGVVIGMMSRGRG